MHYNLESLYTGGCQLQSLFYERVNRSSVSKVSQDCRSRSSFQTRASKAPKETPATCCCTASDTSRLIVFSSSKKREKVWRLGSGHTAQASQLQSVELESNQPPDARLLLLQKALTKQDTQLVSQILKDATDQELEHSLEPQLFDELLKSKLPPASLYGYPVFILEPLSSNQLRRLSAVLCRGKDAQAAWRAYQKLKHQRLRYSTLHSVMVATIKDREPYRAREVFEDIQARGYTPNLATWCQLIHSFNKTRRKGWPYATIAYSLWERLQLEESVNCQLDAASYAIGMMACIGVGKVEEAEGLLEEMKAAGLRPNVQLYNILLKGTARQDLGKMPALLAALRDAGLSPSPATYNTVVDAYANAGQLSQDVVDVLLAGSYGQPAAWEWRGGSRERGAQAKASMREAQQQGLQLDVWAYSSLVKACIRAGDLTQALAALEEMERSGVQPNVVTLSTLLDGCVRAGEMAMAEQIVAGMRQRRIAANVITYNTLLRGYAGKGDFKAVRDVLRRMGEAGVHPREDTFNTLMEGALKNNDLELVPKLFKQLVSLDLQPDSLSYGALITSLARLTCPDSALQAYGELEAQQVCGICLNALISALANAGRMAEAEQQLQRAAALAAEQGCAPPIEAYGTVLKAYAKLRDADAALDVFAEFQQRGGIPDDKLVDMAATACVHAGQFKRALQFVRAMEQEGKHIDKARIKVSLETVLRKREAAYRQRDGNAPSVRNDNLERLKFWLGFPNAYYNNNEEEV